jgi:hypothetical protein
VDCEVHRQSEFRGLGVVIFHEMQGSLFRRIGAGLQGSSHIRCPLLWGNQMRTMLPVREHAINLHDEKSNKGHQSPSGRTSAEAASRL